MKKVTVFKRQDDDGHWFWIPMDDVNDFDRDLKAIEGKSYMDCPDDFDNFNNKYEDYRTGGSPEIAPDYFYKNGFVTEIGVEPECWPEVEDIINQKEVPTTEYIKISYQGGSCLASSAKQAGIIVENEILEDLEKGEIGEITIERVMLSDKEIEEAGEFEGFN